MTAEIKPLFVASHPALDFLNTRFTPHGIATECIADGHAFLTWLVDAEQVSASDAARFKRSESAEALDAVALEARKLRDWAARWLVRWCEAPDADYESERRRLNSLLARASSHRELIQSETGWQLVERNRLQTGDELIALVAARLAALVSAESPQLVRRCAGEACTLWFLDRTKAHRRLFCSASACGNRAKVAAFRERQRRS
jgi:predicted RNA-binding Zn ribbon-like protein